MIQSVAINIRPDDRNSVPYLRELLGFLGERGVRTCLPDIPLVRNEGLTMHIADRDYFRDSADLAVVIGGDGTMLRTARLFAGTDTPIFGINRGRLGFLTEFSPEESFRHLADVLSGKYTAQPRAVLDAVLIRNGGETTTLSFVNDAVISKGAFSRPIHVRLDLDGVFLNSYAGDGIIIATPTGSTAYSLSAGGPIISPAIDSVYIINPVCPHTLAVRPMIVPSSSVLRARIVPQFENLLLTIDGQEALNIEGGDEILIRNSIKKFRIITHPERDYFEILRQKLGWGKNLEEH
jgi:NAD+ kinase